jgi:hypothetical protein
VNAPARVEGVWFRTTARPDSKPCDACRQPVEAGEPIAYRRRGRHSDLLHKDCAGCREAVPGVNVWEHARTASTPEARGQAHLQPVDDEPGPDVAAMVADARARERAAYADLERASGRLAEAADSHAQATATYGLARAALERCERMAER